MFDRLGNLLFVDSESRICKIDLKSGIITTIAGTGKAGYDGDGGPAARAHIEVSGMALDPNGNLFLADWEHNRIRRIDAATGIITTIAGNGQPKRGPHPPIL
jgi:sugar lactone lactonase YvrE